MKGRESEDVEWGGESREERMDYQESLTSISTVTTKLQGPTNRQTDRHTDRQTDRQTDRHTDRQTDTQTDRQTQTDRHTDTT